MRKRIRRHIQKVKIADKLLTNQAMRARAVVLDQLSGKGLTTYLKRAKERGVPPEKLKKLIQLLNPAIEADRIGTYESEMNERRNEAIWKRRKRGKKSPYLLSGLGREKTKTKGK